MTKNWRERLKELRAMKTIPIQTHGMIPNTNGEGNIYWDGAEDIDSSDPRYNIALFDILSYNGCLHNVKDRVDAQKELGIR